MLIFICVGLEEGSDSIQIISLTFSFEVFVTVSKTVLSVCSFEHASLTNVLEI